MIWALVSAPAPGLVTDTVNLGFSTPKTSPGYRRLGLVMGFRVVLGLAGVLLGRLLLLLLLLGLVVGLPGSTGWFNAPSSWGFAPPCFSGSCARFFSESSRLLSFLLLLSYQLSRKQKPRCIPSPDGPVWLETESAAARSNDLLGY